MSFDTYWQRCSNTSHRNERERERERERDGEREREKEERGNAPGDEKRKSGGILVRISKGERNTK